MKIVKPSATLIFPSPAIGLGMLRIIESAARLCYKSEGNQTDEVNLDFIRSKIKMGHLSVIEHSMATVRFVCDRGVSHELVRHRLASFSQESTRYCNYSKDQFGNEITVIEPPFWKTSVRKYAYWEEAMKSAENAYFTLLCAEAAPQEARAVLPNSLKTEIIMTANLREWRHFFNLRALGTTGKPHPQMVEITIPLLKQFKQTFPGIFDDLEVTVNA